MQQKECPNCGCKFSRDYEFCRTSCKNEHEHKLKMREYYAKNPISTRRGGLGSLMLLATALGSLNR